MKIMTHITIGAEKVSLEKPVVMGILNVTPDSFYDGGKYTSELKIMGRVDEIVEQGAGIIDVGAYSTRPGAAFVDAQEELSRLSFAVELIRKYTRISRCRSTRSVPMWPKRSVIVSDR